MNDLEVLVNRKIEKYKKAQYFNSEQKEKVIKKLNDFLEQNRYSFDSDLEEILRLEDDIIKFKEYKNKLESKYEKFISLKELKLMKLKRDDKIAYDIYMIFQKLEVLPLQIKMNLDTFQRYEYLLIKVDQLNQKYENGEYSQQRAKEEIQLINSCILKIIKNSNTISLKTCKSLSKKENTKDNCINEQKKKEKKQ